MVHVPSMSASSDQRWKFTPPWDLQSQWSMIAVHRLQYVIVPEMIRPLCSKPGLGYLKFDTMYVPGYL